MTSILEGRKDLGAHPRQFLMARAATGGSVVAIHPKPTENRDDIPVHYRTSAKLIGNHHGRSYRPACKQDQILKTKTKTAAYKTKTKITRPRPRSPEVNKGT